MVGLDIDSSFRWREFVTRDLVDIIAFTINTAARVANSRQRKGVFITHV